MNSEKLQNKKAFVSLVIAALIRALISLVPGILLTPLISEISLLDLGLLLVFLFISLYIFGITLGLFVLAGLLRFGPSFKILFDLRFFYWLFLDLSIILSKYYQKIFNQ